MALKTVGSLWKKEGRKGNFLTGVLDLGVLGRVNIAVFQNEKGEGDEKKPDASLCLFVDDE